jgi:drug/metabolite transporter (DMT)-like permease
MRPPVTAVMARLLLNEPLGLTGAAGCFVSVAGVTILAHPPFLFGGHSSWGHKRLLGTLSGVASTLFASGTSYTIRRCGEGLGCFVMLG